MTLPSHSSAPVLSALEARKPTMFQWLHSFMYSASPMPSLASQARRGFAARLVIGFSAVPLRAPLAQSTIGRPVVPRVYFPSATISVSPGWSARTALPNVLHGRLALVPSLESLPAGDR